MKNMFVFLIGTTGFGCCIANLSCKHRPEMEQQTELFNPTKGSEKEKLLMAAEEIAEREYGSMIKDELPLRAQLIGDSVWVVQGTLAKGTDGGAVYMVLRKGDNKLLKITHYK